MGDQKRTIVLHKGVETGASGDGPEFIVVDEKHAEVTIGVDSYTDGQLDVVVQDSDDGTTYRDRASFGSINSASSETIRFENFGQYLMVHWTFTGTTISFSVIATVR